MHTSNDAKSFSQIVVKFKVYFSFIRSMLGIQHDIISFTRIQSRYWWSKGCQPEKNVFFIPMIIS